LKKASRHEVEKIQKTQKGPTKGVLPGLSCKINIVQGWDMERTNWKVEKNGMQGASERTYLRWERTNHFPSEGPTKGVKKDAWRKIST